MVTVQWATLKWQYIYIYIYIICWKAIEQELATPVSQHNSKHTHITLWQILAMPQDIMDFYCYIMENNAYSN